MTQSVQAAGSQSSRSRTGVLETALRVSAHEEGDEEGADADVDLGTLLRTEHPLCNFLFRSTIAGLAVSVVSVSLVVGLSAPPGPPTSVACSMHTAALPTYPAGAAIAAAAALFALVSIDTMCFVALRISKTKGQPFSPHSALLQMVAVSNIICAGLCAFLASGSVVLYKVPGASVCEYYDTPLRCEWRGEQWFAFVNVPALRVRACVARCV